jgi:hypothetical protein
MQGDIPVNESKRNENRHFQGKLKNLIQSN